MAAARVLSRPSASNCASRQFGAGATRDYDGALSLMTGRKGISVTTSAVSQPAIDTACGLCSRFVLIDGLRLSGLMIRYNVENV